MRLLIERALVLFSTILAVSSYSVVDTVIGSQFYDFFGWEAIADPTRGRVNYVDQETSQNLNLTYASDNTFILRADYKTYLDPSGPGRNSVRIKSHKTFTQHVAVFDVRHMPQGCGTWPAVWEVAPDNWPQGGEVDIVEGVNDQSPNLSVLHTSEGCTMPSSRRQKGNSVLNDCNVHTTNNQGCGVKYPSALSYGPTFNDNGGGWFVMERTSSYFKMWFWSRHDRNVPTEVKHGLPYVNPDSWGQPVAYFPDTQCDFPSHFWEHAIIINLTFCGDWAGGSYHESGCPSTCDDYVNNNPDAFSNAYFDFASIRVYQ